MAKALDGRARSGPNNAPRITTITIPKDKIREVIGSGGKVIREIFEVDRLPRSTSRTTARSRSRRSMPIAAQAAIDWIRGIVAEPEVGMIYNGKVVKIVDFGAFVNFLGAATGSSISASWRRQRVGKTTDVVNVGDPVKVKVLGFDDRGKVKLSMKQVDQATGEDITRQAWPKKSARTASWTRKLTQSRQARSVTSGCDRQNRGFAHDGRSLGSSLWPWRR